MSTNVGALSGIAMSNSCCMFIYFWLTFSCIECSSYSCLGHVVNLGNVDIMARIMKIAAVKNAMTIWGYDPTWDDNHVLGSFLDVIMAIRTLAIKVSISWLSKFTSNSYMCRSKHLNNASNISEVSKSNLAFLKHSRSLYTAMFTGEWHSRCLTRQTNFDKYYPLFTCLADILTWFT